MTVKKKNESGNIILKVMGFTRYKSIVSIFIQYKTNMIKINGENLNFKYNIELNPHMKHFSN